MAIRRTHQGGGRTTGRQPQRMATVLAELMARSGFAGRQAAAQYEQAWREAAGPLLAEQSRPGRLRAGVLEVVAGSSAVVQELTFEKDRLLAALRRSLPEQRIRDLRFRVGRVEGSR